MAKRRITSILSAVTAKSIGRIVLVKLLVVLGVAVSTGSVSANVLVDGGGCGLGCTAGVGSDGIATGVEDVPETGDPED